MQTFQLVPMNAFFINIHIYIYSCALLRTSSPLFKISVHRNGPSHDRFELNLSIHVGSGETWLCFTGKQQWPLLIENLQKMKRNGC